MGRWADDQYAAAWPDRFTNTTFTQLSPESAGRRFAQASVIPDNVPMQILINGAPTSIDASQTIAELLLAQGLAERRVAVEVNSEIIPRSRHTCHALAEGDRVEIVHALGGG